MAQATKKKAETNTLEFQGGFSSFAVKDVEAAMEFYGETLGLEVSEMMGGFELEIPTTDDKVFVYKKPEHRPAVFTVFNLNVDDIAAAAKVLKARGVQFESYDKPMKTDENDIFWGEEKGEGPNIAWFKDPSGNIVSILEPM
jgi:predicted enzyme related to lactoylglutathione lyase